MSFSFRPTTPADRDEWSRMRFDLWPECPFDRHQLEIAQLEGTGGIVVVAELVASQQQRPSRATELGGALVGFAEVSIRSDHVEGTSIAPVPYLEGWYVKPEVRGRGVGVGLLRFVEQWALQQGFSELASDAELHNTKSIRLHGKLGFRETGRTVHFVKQLKAAS